MHAKIIINQNAIKSIENAAKKAAIKTMNQVEIDLVNSQTMPFDTGDMQNNQTFVVKTEDGAKIVTGSPQARRLYYHPEYDFQQGKNANAGALWFDPYFDGGDKKDFIPTHFAENLKEEMRRKP